MLEALNSAIQRVRWTIHFRRFIFGQIAIISKLEENSGTTSTDSGRLPRERVYSRLDEELVELKTKSVSAKIQRWRICVESM
jgi:hypothetical protein